MPPKGISRVIRPCLVCSSQTRAAHLGIDVCRACSVFYRRTEKSENDYTCRTQNNVCPVGPDIKNCKKCRFDHINRLLKQRAGETASFDSSDEQEPPSIKSNEPQEGFRICTSDRLLCSPSTSETPPSPSTVTELPILTRLKAHYRSMCRERLNSELHARPNQPHPLEISLENGPFFPASFGSLTISNRILLTALLDFGVSVFPELAAHPIKDRWDITVNVFYPFRQFEGFYRAGILFPDDPDKAFVGFTTWFSANYMDDFYRDAPSGDIRAAQEHLKKHSTMRVHEIRATREKVQRANLCHEEFLVLIALMFWAFGDLPVSDVMIQLGERYRESIMKELHVFYREQQRLDDYATRLGEFMLLLPIFDRARDLKEHFEMLRLLGVLPEDHFSYQLQRH